jgi:hypothetical protein
MSEKENQVKIGVDYATGERLRFLSEKSGFSMAYILRELSKIVDFIPDNANRITLLIALDAKTRQVKLCAVPLYVGTTEESLKELLEN